VSGGGAPAGGWVRVGLGLVVGLAFAAPLLTGLRYGGLDHSLVLLGMQCALRDGQGLALDPALGGGSPLLAEPQAGMLYPLSWALRPVADPELAASLWSALHLGVAAWAAALLGERAGLRPAGALALGLLHALSGTTLNLILHGPYLVGAAFLPLAWAGARGVAAGLPRGPVELAAAVGLLLLGGELQATAVAGLIAAAELAGARAGRWRWLAAGAAIAVGLLVGLAQWLPTLGLRAAVARAGGLELAQQTLWSLGLPEALAMAWPGVAAERFSSGATLLHLWAGAAEARVPWNPTPHLGLGVLALGVGGAAHPAGRRWALIGALGLLMALGHHTPVYGLVEAVVPPLGLFRYPAKYLGPAGLALAVGALMSLQGGAGSRRLEAAIGAAVGLSALGLVAVVAGGPELQAAADGFSFGVRTLPGVRPEPAALLLQRGGQATAFGLLLLLVWRRWRAWAPAALVAEALVAAPAHVELLPPVLAFDAPRAALGPDATLCVDPSLPTGRLDTPDRDWGLYGVTLTQRLQMKANLQQCGGPAVPQHYLATATAPTVALWHAHLPDPTTAWPAAVALGCTHTVSARPLPGAPVDDGTPASLSPPLIALDGALPAVRGAPAPALHPSASAAVAAALRAADPGAVVGQLDDPEGQLMGPPPAGAGGARVVEGATDRVLLEVDGPGVYVLRRPWWPGWSAAQGGQGAPVLRAAGVQLAVVADRAGPLELRYAPPLLPAGLTAGLLGLLGLLGLAIAAGRPQPKSPVDR